MYVGYYKTKETMEGENPPGGLNFCASKSDTVVGYALGDRDEAIFTSRYRVALLSEEELQRELERGRDALMGVFGE
mgnify:FL=1